MTTSLVRPGLAVAALALVAACGSSGSGTASGPSGPSTPAMPSMSMPASVPAATTAAGTSAPAAAEPVVHIKDFMFSAPSARVTAGSTFMVVNDDAVPHTYETVTKGGFDSGSIAPGASKELTAPAAGTYDLKCDFHPSMHGTLTVG